MTTKICIHKKHTGDRQTPITQFRRDKQKKSGFSSYCNVCQKRIADLYRAKNKQKVNAAAKLWNKNNPTKTKEIAAKYATKESSKIIRRARDIISYHNNGPHPSRVIATKNWQQTKYHNDAIWRQRRLDYGVVWSLENKDRWAATSKLWRKNNKHLVCMSVSQRRATKLKATPIWVDVEAIRSIYEAATNLHQHVHHIIPLKQLNWVCGLHCADNLISLSPEEHRKAHKSLDNLMAYW